MSDEASGPPSTRAMFTQYAVIDSFLGTEQADQLLQFAIENENKFAPAHIASENTSSALDNEARRAWEFGDRIGELGRAFKESIYERVDDFLASVGLPMIESPEIELSMAAHRDGGFFAEHIDTFTDAIPSNRKSNRVLSAVYYFHREPAGFSGGQLALLPMTGEAAPILVEPVHDRLVLFPSFAPHEVLPISIPGDAFADARFSLNCWVRR